MKNCVTYIVLTAVLLGIAGLSRTGADMKHIKDGRFRVRYSGDKRMHIKIPKIVTLHFWLSNFGKVQNYLHHRLSEGKLYEAGKSSLG